MSNHHHQHYHNSIGAQSIGSIIVIDEQQFEKIIATNPHLLVVTTYRESLISSNEHRYLLSYKGFLFFTTSVSPLHLPKNVEIIEVEEIAIPKVNKWWSWSQRPWDY